MTCTGIIYKIISVFAGATNGGTWACLTIRWAGNAGTSIIKIFLITWITTCSILTGITVIDTPWAGDWAGVIVAIRTLTLIIFEDEIAIAIITDGISIGVAVLAICYSAWAIGSSNRISIIVVPITFYGGY